MTAARSRQQSYGLRIVGLLRPPSLSFRCRRAMATRDYEGLPVRLRPGVGSTNGLTLMTFASPSEMLSSSRCSFLPFRSPAGRPEGLPCGEGVGGELLSWGCQRSPLHRHRCLCPLPVASLLRRAASRRVPRNRAVWRVVTFGPELPPSGLVPSLPFLPASTVYSTLHFPGLLHPGADRGVRQVSASASFFRALSRGRPARMRSLPAWPFPRPRRGSGPTSPIRPFRLLRRGGGAAFAATGSSVDRVVIPTGALPCGAFPLPVAGFASTVPSDRASVGRGSARQAWCRLFLGDGIGHLARATAVRALSSLLATRARHHRPPARGGLWRVAVAGHSTSGPWSTVKSVTALRRFRRFAARCSLGLSSFEGLFPSRADHLVIAVPMCRSTRRRTPKHPGAISIEPASPPPGRGQVPGEPGAGVS